MDQFKVSIGPFELFSYFISGLPLLLALYIWYFPLFTIEQIGAEFLKYSSLSILLIIVVASYLLGALLSGFTWRYFKVLHLVFKFMIKHEHEYVEKALLKGLNEIKEKLSKEQFFSLTYEDRLAYMVKQLIGSAKHRWVLARLMSFLRQNGVVIAAIADSYIANHIMYRSLSFGFLMLTIALIRSVVLKGIIWDHHTFYSIITLIFSIMAFLRSITFKHWWAREILTGFYSIAIKDYLDDDYRFGAETPPLAITNV